MCLITFAYKVHPDYPFLLVGNRDEFLERPTARAGWWDDHPQVYAGRDLRAGGTWMGVSKTGKIAALTNFRQGRDSMGGAKSRGQILKDYLISQIGPREFLNKLMDNSQSYNPFNLLIGNGRSMYYYSNYGDFRPKKLEKGIYGLSNNYLNVPWPKVKKAKKNLRNMIRKPGFSPHDLFQVLADKKEAEDSQLPDTKIPYVWEKKLSAMFIETPDYATRVMTVIVVDNKGVLSMEERAFFPHGEPKRIQIPVPS